MSEYPPAPNKKSPAVCPFITNHRNLFCLFCLFLSLLCAANRKRCCKITLDNARAARQHQIERQTEILNRKAVFILLTLFFAQTACI